jgi:uncharacterized protein (TIGR02145 family)
VLEGAVDSQYGIGDPEWDIVAEYRGYDVGNNLKTTYGWYQGGNGIDLYGFSGMPAGGRFENGQFDRLTHLSMWWSSSVYNFEYAWARYIYFSMQEICRNFNFRIYGFSVRCVRNE